MTDLFIIEAPGKARQLEAILASLGLDARVQATKGHLMSLPDRLTPVGIDRSMRDFARAPIDPAIATRIRDEAAKADRVVIATDADAEGDVIAWDVAELISDLHASPVRARLRGMDADSICEAISEVSPVLKRDAVAGRTRAIVDRMIGAAFSGGGVAVGRVGTAILGLVAKQPPAVRKLRLVAPADDAGRPWTAEGDIRHPLDLETAQRLAALDLPALRTEAASPPLPSRPAHMGDIMVRAGDKLGIGPREAERSLQRVYEGGLMSYPRAGSRGVSRTVARKLAKLFKEAGHRFDDAVVPEKAENEVHDAPYPIGRVNVSHDPQRLGSDEGVRTMVARDLVRCGQKHAVETALTKPLDAFLAKHGFSREVREAVCAMEWRREIGPRYPGQVAWPESEVVERRPDTVLLEAVVSAGLGRPSTWANHVESFLSRGLVDEEMRLTDKGRTWLEGSPAELLDPRISAAIEQACEKVPERFLNDPSREPWELLAERIVTALPHPIRERIQAAADPAKHPLVSVREAFGVQGVEAEPELRTDLLHQ